MSWRLFLICLLAGAGPLARASLPPDYGTLVLGRNANADVERAASDLADLLEREFGERPAVRRERLVEWSPVLRIGPMPDHPGFDKDPLTDEVLVERTRGGLIIAGGDNTATVFAVYRFLQVFLGWRYYQPGPLGLEQVAERPPPPSVRGEASVLLAEQAGFHSRNLGGLGSPAGSIDWNKWHGQRERFQFNHTLHRAVTPDLFEKHPDWFAKDAGGRPMRPPFAVPHGYNDHPDLSQPGVREHVLKWAADELAENGNAYPLPSVSLSLGDAFEFGHFPESYRWRPRSYFRRWPDWSNHVFAYTNAVAEGLIGQAGGAATPAPFIGALSYLTWEAPPEFEVHPSIVPYLTYDRSQWYDPAARADDLANVEAWVAKQTRVVGTWDYLFGYGFLMPRSMTGIVSDSIPELHRRGVRAYFSQVAAIWPYDVHTTWLTARLLWDPDADSADMVDSFFRTFYGNAAGPMRRFFDRAESVWMDQEDGRGERGWWLRYWKDPWQAGLWQSDDLLAMQGDLDKALEATRNGPERFHGRVRQTADLFAVTRSFIESENLAWSVQSGDTSRAGPALEAREELETLMRQVLREHPLAARAGDLSWIHRYDSLGGPLAHARSRETGGALQAELEQWCRLQGFSGLPEEGPAQNILYDTRFAHVDNRRIWHWQYLDSENRFMAKGQMGKGFVAENVRQGHIYQLFEAVPGDFYLGELKLETDQSLSGEVYIRVDFFDVDNQLISRSRRARIAPVGQFGRHQVLRALNQAPEGATRGRLFIRFYELDRDRPVYLHQAEVRHLPRRVR